jgi:hypothetical protein
MGQTFKNLKHIDGEKLEVYLQEAGVPAFDSPTAALSVIRPIDDALTLGGLTREDLGHIDEALSERQKSLNLAVDMGMGMAAIGIVGSPEVIDLFIRVGGCLGDIVANNIDTLFTDTTFHLLQNGMIEVVLNLPGGTMALAQSVATLAVHPAETIETISLTIQYGADFIDALDAAALGADLLDAVDALSTLGLSLLLSLGVRAYVKHKYEPILKDRETSLTSQRKKYANLQKLRSSLGAKLPVRMVAAQLANVDRHHWGF